MAPYPEQINLPFNYASIRHDFQLRPGSRLPPENHGAWVMIQGETLLLDQRGATFSLPEGRLPEWLEQRINPICIGSWKDRPLRIAELPPGLDIQAPFTVRALNTGDNQLDIQTLTLGGVGRQILHWENQSRHCSRCGAATEHLSKSWGRHCKSCGAYHYPHIHPCSIVLVRRDDRILLARKPEWPEGRYGLIAGFVEFGESLEECAVREVREEAGLLIENVRYVASQNWPFPAQLMAGFVADFAGGEIAVDHAELEDVRWFYRDSLPELPARHSIARWIIDNFTH